MPPFRKQAIAGCTDSKDAQDEDEEIANLTDEREEAEAITYSSMYVPFRQCDFPKSRTDTW